MPARLPRSIRSCGPFLHEEEIAVLDGADSVHLPPQGFATGRVVLEEGDQMTRDTMRGHRTAFLVRCDEVPQAGKLAPNPARLTMHWIFATVQSSAVWDAEDAPEVDQLTVSYNILNAHAPKRRLRPKG